MKLSSLLLLVVCLVSFSGIAYAGSNALAIGTEQVTKTPFTLLKNGNEHLFTPVKDIDAAVLDFTDNARAAVVSVGLNFGEAVEW